MGRTFRTITSKQRGLVGKNILKGRYNRSRKAAFKVNRIGRRGKRETGSDKWSGLALAHLEEEQELEKRVAKDGRMDEARGERREEEETTTALARWSTRER